jgi:SAM-dependent methyltransferase
MLQKGFDYNSSLKFNVLIHNLEITPWPVPSKIFTVINFTNVLEHLENRKQALNEICRLLMSDESVCLISIPNRNSTWKKILRYFDLDSRDDPDHKIEYSKDAISRELADSSLLIVGQVIPQTPSLPINGIFSLVSVLSPSIYNFMQNLKKLILKKSGSDEAKGWLFQVKREAALGNDDIYIFNLDALLKIS